MACAVSLACCARSLKGPADTFFQREPVVDHEKPEPRDSGGEWWDQALQGTIRPLGRAISPATYMAKVVGGPEALDVNDFDQVVDSTWFANRINRGLVTTADIRRGPGASRAPARGPLLVVSGKLEGVSPGFVVRDTAGVVWFVKFDEPGYPTLTTGAEMITSRILATAGYNVPENFLVNLVISRLRLAEGAQTVDDYNRKVPLDDRALAKLMRQLNPDADGRLRAMFSRQLRGEPLGPFRYSGVRSDDPNDTIPHERRRSLRGLRVFFAWLNNTDASDANTFDTFVKSSDDHGHVVHHIIDFGDSLGAARGEDKATQVGYEGRTDWQEIGLRWLTFGFRDPLWIAVERSPLREVGVFESRVFELSRWTPLHGNPAFEAATAADELWAASIIAHFTEDDIRAAVASAEYREPLAAEWVTRVLLRRRIKILEHAFSKGAPFDQARVVDGVLRVTDLKMLAGLDEAGGSYHWNVRWNRPGDRDKHLGSADTDTPELSLPIIVRGAHERWGDAFVETPILTFRLWRKADSDPQPVEIDVEIRDGRAYAVAMRR